MKKKELFAGILIGSLVTSAAAFAVQYTATENPFPIKLNGQDVQLEGYNINDSTYFKLRDIADVVGGFSVGFEDNTIQLSKNGYVYDNQSENAASNINNESIIYYTDLPWLPDFGAYTGGTVDTRKGSGWIYDNVSQDKFDEYKQLLLSMGFVKGQIEGKLTFVKGDCFISFVSDNVSLGLVGFTAGSGDFVNTHFIAE